MAVWFHRRWLCGKTWLWSAGSGPYDKHYGFVTLAFKNDKGRSVQLPSVRWDEPTARMAKRLLSP